ncbi:S66 peptidase family protein [Demetria terragena]|uniref:S66 peptidase family protein n=1 Tax=Demetria terragena TaxID=63959 RepID=UPI0003771DBE|nr:LD-carboxypeptidase [Demetria terragena]
MFVAPAAGLKPAPLRAGSRVAMVAASGPPLAERLAYGLEVLQDWGLEVDVLSSCSAPAEPFEYLAGTDAARAEDLTTALTDPSYEAVFLAKGGYGAQRTLEHLDWADLAARQPTPRHVVGFSDVTAIQEGALRHLGWASLHAAMPATTYFSMPRAVGSLWAQLFKPESVGVLHFADAVPVVDGVAEGVVVGGCATLIASSLATDTGLSARGAILFLEDVDEELFRLDRVFTHLRRSGYLDGVRGILTGSFEECGDPALVQKLLVDRFGDLGVPVLTGADIGHGVALQALPIGLTARLDTSQRELAFV